MAEKSRGKQHKARSKLSKQQGHQPTVNQKLRNFEEGETARIKIDPSIQKGRPHARFHGKTGEVTGEQGDSYEITFKDGKTQKKLYIKPYHLQKVE